MRPNMLRQQDATHQKHREIVAGQIEIMALHLKTHEKHAALLSAHFEMPAFQNAFQIFQHATIPLHDAMNKQQNATVQEQNDVMANRERRERSSRFIRFIEGGRRNKCRLSRYSLTLAPASGFNGLQMRGCKAQPCSNAGSYLRCFAPLPFCFFLGTFS